MSRAPRTDAERVAMLTRAIAAMPTPRPTQGPRAAAVAMQRAQALACLVRDEDATAIGDTLDGYTLTDLYALVVTLAAMVPLDAPAGDLLAWVTDRIPTPEEPAA